jgi:hypothetical protein
MSCVCEIMPMFSVDWSVFNQALDAAARLLGFEVVSDAGEIEARAALRRSGQVRLEVSQAELVADRLSRDQRLSVTRDGVTVTFSRNARGKASLCVTGTGQSEEILRLMGEEMSRCIIQQYVYQRLKDEMRVRGFNIVEEETGANRSIRLKVRRWEE